MMTEILDTCRIWRDIDKHPLPEKTCKIDLKLDCGSILIRCQRNYYMDIGSGNCDFRGEDVEYIGEITKWRLSK